MSNILQFHKRQQKEVTKKFRNEIEEIIDVNKQIQNVLREVKNNKITNLDEAASEIQCMVLLDVLRNSLENEEGERNNGKSNN